MTDPQLEPPAAGGRTGHRSDAPGSQTRREISQQPRLWRDLQHSLGGTAPESDLTRRWVSDALRDPATRILLAGAGTSALVGEVAAPYLRRVTGRRVEAIATTDIVGAPALTLVEDVPTLMVSFARSGNSPESLAATRIASSSLTRVSHLIITCDPSGQLARAHADHVDSLVVSMPAEANDQGLAMTSSFTCMLLAALLLLADPPSSSGSPSRDDGRRLVDRLSACADHVITTFRPFVSHLLRDRSDPPTGVVYLAGTALRGVADESALKVLELTAGHVRASSETTLAFRHGPKALLSQNPVVVVYVSNDPLSRLYDLDMLTEVLAEQEAGNTIAVSAQRTGVPSGAVFQALPGVEDLPDSFLALPAVICAQMLATAWSDSLDLDPDNPFPGGSVNRVVRGVRLHEVATSP